MGCNSQLIRYDASVDVADTPNQSLDVLVFGYDVVNFEPNDISQTSTHTRSVKVDLVEKLHWP